MMKGWDMHQAPGLKPLRNYAAGPVAIAALLAVAGCSPPAPPVKLHEAMTTVVAPQAQVLWDVSNKATNDAGEPDASKLTPADWAMLVEASGKLRDTASVLANAKKIQVVSEGEKIQDEGQPESSSGAQVQGFIDKDPATFAKHAKALETSAGAFFAAASAKDAVKLADASNGLDQVCEACHVVFWYPQQQKPAE